MAFEQMQQHKVYQIRNPMTDDLIILLSEFHESEASKGKQIGSVLLIPKYQVHS